MSNEYQRVMTSPTKQKSHTVNSSDTAKMTPAQNRPTGARNSRLSQFFQSTGAMLKGHFLPRGAASPLPVRGQGSVIRPPHSGLGAPVVPGKLSGRPATTRAARKPKHCASSASPSQPTASTGSTGAPSASRNARMIAGLCRPPPPTSQRCGGSGSFVTATAAAVNATSVAAPSAGDSASIPQAASVLAKSSRSSDFGAGRAKYGSSSSRLSTAASATPSRASAPSASNAAPVWRATQSSNG